MNIVEIETCGQVIGNERTITIRDGYGQHVFRLPVADIEAAEAQGMEALLDLVVSNCGDQGYDILLSAAEFRRPVTLNLSDVPTGTLSAALDAYTGPTVSP